MAHVSDLIATDIEQYLKNHENKSLLRFITCGSVDDGKSTLIGRLLYESKMLFEDQLAAVEADSKKWGTQGAELDFALLVDGLAAEREQGITIDVAYRFFSTDRRKFIVADTPGHEQYTRNMVTGASTADAAVLMVDARRGVLTQTRRHSYLVSLLGIRHIIVAINKMDLVDYAEDTFRRIVEDYRQFARSLDIADITFIPLSAFRGDNVVETSKAMPWYVGPTLMEYLETVEIDENRMRQTPFRMPVQWVNRPNLDFRGFAGTIAGGVIRPGDRICVQPSGRESNVARIVAHGGDLARAVAGQSVTLTLTDEIDISRGDVISAVEAPVGTADQFEATLVWMHEAPLLPGRPYLLKIGAKTVTATVTAILHQVNVNTQEHIAADRLDLNAIGVCQLSLDRPIAFDPYAENRDTGGFILIDRIDSDTVGAGLLRIALRRAAAIPPARQEAVDKAARAASKGQKPCVVWLTGLPGAGKSTLARRVEQKLHALERHTYLIDGEDDKKNDGENSDRATELARRLVDAGLIVIIAVDSPSRAERRRARDRVAAGEFVEVFVDTPPGIAEERNAASPRAGERHPGGSGESYEAPEAPELRIEAAVTIADEGADRVVEALERLGYLAA